MHSLSIALFFSSALSYLVGSIPFGLIFSHLLGKGDLRKFGSGNIGATNAFRKSKTLGILTLVCDIGKGVLAVYLAGKFSEDYIIRLSASACAVAGHIFSIWLQFRGGKGVATAIGVFFMTNWQVGIFIAITWALVFIIGRISGLAAIASFVVAPVITYCLTYDINLTIANSIICTLVIIKHYKNLKDLLSTLI